VIPERIIFVSRGITVYEKIIVHQVGYLQEYDSQMGTDSSCPAQSITIPAGLSCFVLMKFTWISCKKSPDWVDF